MVRIFNEMILRLLQRLPKSQYAMVTKCYALKKPQPDEIAEMEEMESHDWGTTTEKDMLQRNYTSMYREYEYWSEHVMNGEECVSIEIARVKKVSKK